MVARLIEIMREDDGWAGETHIQKSMFFLNRLLSVPTRYEFVLYMHGPYSFDLHDDLGAMRADLILGIKPRASYGASFELGQFGKRAIERSKGTVQTYESRLQFVSKRIGVQNIRTLERYSTALYVKSSNPDADESSMAHKIVSLKPYIPVELALEAVRAVAGIEKDARNAGLIDS